jgi:hypothetical protein
MRRMEGGLGSLVVFCYIRTYGMICSVIAGHQLISCPVITGHNEGGCHGLTGHSYETRI